MKKSKTVVLATLAVVATLITGTAVMAESSHGQGGSLRAQKGQMQTMKAMDGKAGHKGFFDGTMSSGRGMKGGFDRVLTSLVSDGTLNQTQADAVKSTLESAKPATPPTTRPTAEEMMAGLKTVLDGLASKGTLTDAQVTSILNAVDAQKSAAPANDKFGKGPKGPQGFGGILVNLVTDGTLTQAKADAIKSALKAARPTTPPTTPPTVEERKQAFTTVLNGLVASNTLTETEADAVTKAYENAKSLAPAKGQLGNGAKGEKGRHRQSNIFADLVSKGTLTQAEADAVKSALHDAKPATRPATIEEAKAGFKAVLDSLVTKGTLTADKAAAIQAAIQAAMPPALPATSRQ